MDHLEELRWRLIKMVAVILVLAIVIFIFIQPIFDTVFYSMANSDFISFRVICKYLGLCSEKYDLDQLQNMKMSGQFSMSMTIALLGGVVISFPFLFSQLWGFIKPGLRKNEAKAVRGMVIYVSLLFFLGILFGYFVVSPLVIQFFGNFQITDIAKVENRFLMSDFITTVTSTTLYSGFIFLLPVLIYVFSKLGLVTPAFLKKYRKHSIVLVLLLSAIITPPDFWSQVIVSIPILLLYELGILLSKKVEKNQSYI
jgi:sec-independent protein translocase protein TatC